MPLYEYACTDCDHEFEKLRPMSQMDYATSCPECNAEAERQLSVFSAFSSSSSGEMSAVAGAGGGCCGGGGGGCACAMGV